MYITFKRVNIEQSVSLKMMINKINLVLYENGMRNAKSQTQHLIKLRFDNIKRSAMKWVKLI